MTMSGTQPRQPQASSPPPTPRRNNHSHTGSTHWATVTAVLASTRPATNPSKSPAGASRPASRSLAQHEAARSHPANSRVVSPLHPPQRPAISAPNLARNNPVRWTLVSPPTALYRTAIGPIAISPIVYTVGMNCFYIVRTKPHIVTMQAVMSFPTATSRTAINSVPRTWTASAMKLKEVVWLHRRRLNRPFPLRRLIMLSLILMLLRWQGREKASARLVISVRMIHMIRLVG
ncbi:hypothetical protein LTR86_005753 [Recurvomyces mirabilis]|nr:hypothetical protein LTR86_005753 [Recurvomyces mirabilis]